MMMMTRDKELLRTKKKKKTGARVPAVFLFYSTVSEFSDWLVVIGKWFDAARCGRCFGRCFGRCCVLVCLLSLAACSGWLFLDDGCNVCLQTDQR